MLYDKKKDKEAYIMESFENNEFENEPEVSPESSAQPSRYAANDGAYQTAGTGRR